MYQDWRKVIELFYIVKASKRLSYYSSGRTKKRDVAIKNNYPL